MNFISNASRLFREITTLSKIYVTDSCFCFRNIQKNLNFHLSTNIIDQFEISINKQKIILYQELFISQKRLSIYYNLNMMLSTLTAGRALFITSIKTSAPRYATHTLQTSKPVGHGFISTSGKQPVRHFTKSNGLMARFGARERATPVKTSIEHVGTMHNYGMLSIGVAGAAGIGALCYYGLGMSNVEGALERSVLWPQFVRDRIHSTYAHLGVGFGISAGAAYATFKSPAAMRLLSSGSMLLTFGSLAALVASSMVVQSIPYEPGFGTKQLAWVSHCSLLGMILAPLSMFGGPAIIRAATYTAGIVGGLSAIAVCAPSERFLVTTAPISIGLGAVVASSIGSMFLPPTSKIGLGLYGIALYGGLIVFSGLLLYDTQKTIKKAELHPAYSMAPYDPINNSLHIYLDIINIFIRVLMIFGSSQKRK